MDHREAKILVDHSSERPDRYPAQVSALPKPGIWAIHTLARHFVFFPSQNRQDSSPQPPGPYAHIYISYTDIYPTERTPLLARQRLVVVTRNLSLACSAHLQRSSTAPSTMLISRPLYTISACGRAEWAHSHSRHQMPFCMSLMACSLSQGWL